jgi:hypothetical protein
MNTTTAYNTFNLQSTLGSASPPTEPPPEPHHPIMCTSDHLWYDEAGRLGCQHTQVDADDRRTQSCLDHSIAILLMEMMAEKESRHAG